MALKLGNSGSGLKIPVNQETNDDPTTKAFDFSILKQQAAAQSVAPAAPANSVPSWLRSGDAAQAAFEAERARVEAIRQEIASGKQAFIPRFWLEENESAHIIFLDGDLILEGKYKGNLSYYATREHTVQLATGRWDNFVCCEERDEMCPISDGNGDHKPSLCALFTVIDTRKIPSKKNPGQFFENERRLFVAKSGTLSILQKIAVKSGGLHGLAIEASRTGAPPIPRVGSVFLPEGKLTDEQLLQHFGQEDQQRIVPFDYDQAITYRSPEQIATLIGGKTPAGFSALPKSKPSGPPGEVPF